MKAYHLLLSMMVILLSPMRPSAQICGDADGSGTTSLTDGVAVLRAAAGLTSTCVDRVCDVDGSGAVSVTDGVVVLLRAADLSAPISCGTGFGDLVKSVRVQGRLAELRLDAPPTPPNGAPQDIVAIDGDTQVTGGADASFNVQLARPVDSLILALQENGVPVDGFVEVPVSGGGSVPVTLSIAADAAGTTPDLTVASRSNGDLGAFQARTLTVAEAGKVVCNEGDELTVLRYGSNTESCVIDTATDIDVFAFDGTAGEDLRIVLFTEQGLDPRLEVRDPDGVRIVDTGCTGACALTVDSTQPGSRLLPVLPKTGAYTLNVSDSNSNEGGTYQLHVERFRPVTPPLLAIGTSYDDQIAPATDVDTFAFSGSAGDDLRIVVNTTQGLDARLEVRDPDGVRIVDTSCTGACSLTADSTQTGARMLPVLAKTGAYSINISDSNSNEGGTYTVLVQCLFGPCL